MSRNDYSVPNLERALVIIEHLARNTGGGGVSDLAARLGLPKNSVFRILRTLNAHGYVERADPGKTYRLGKKLLSLGYAAIGESNLVEKSLDAMRELRDETRETVLLGTLVGEQGVVLEQMASPLPLKFLVEPGHRFPLHTAAPGKAMMAFLPAQQREKLIRRLKYPRYNPRTIPHAKAMARALEEVRKKGYALDLGEHVEGLHCVAAPVFNRFGYPIAALWVTGPSLRIPRRIFPRLARRVIEKARRISNQLGYDLL